MAVELHVAVEVLVDVVASSAGEVSRLLPEEEVDSEEASEGSLVVHSEAHLVDLSEAVSVVLPEALSVEHLEAHSVELQEVASVVQLEAVSAVVLLGL